jgi:hypothetical protein
MTAFLVTILGSRNYKNELRILKFDILTKGTSYTNSDLESFNLSCFVEQIESIPYYQYVASLHAPY